MMSNLPSPSKSSTATAWGLVPPTPVLSAIFNPDAAVTSVNCFRAWAGRRDGNNSSSRQAQRMEKASLLAVEDGDGLCVAVVGHPIALGVRPDQVQQLDLVAERVGPGGPDQAMK